MWSIFFSTLHSFFSSSGTRSSGRREWISFWLRCFSSELRGPPHTATDKCVWSKFIWDYCFEISPVFDDRQCLVWFLVPAASFEIYTLIDDMISNPATLQSIDINKRNEQDSWYGLAFILINSQDWKEYNHIFILFFNSINKKPIELIDKTQLGGIFSRLAQRRCNLRLKESRPLMLQCPQRRPQGLDW